MKPTPRPQRRSGGTDRVAAEDVDALLAVLADEDCRALMGAADGDALSASELSEACDLPLSTTYRKVERLAEAGLFEERLRIRSSGKHTSEYTLQVENVQMSLSGEGVDVEMSRSRDASEPSLSLPGLAGAD